MKPMASRMDADPPTKFLNRYLHKMPTLYKFNTYEISYCKNYLFFFLFFLPIFFYLSNILKVHIMLNLRVCETLEPLNLDYNLRQHSQSYGTPYIPQSNNYY